MHPDGKRVGHVAVTQDLHTGPVGALDESGLHEPVGIDDAAGGEAAQRLDVHDRVARLAAEGQEAALGQAPVERHLPALEPGALHAAGARALALDALAGGLAAARARAPADPLASMRGAG